MGILTLSDMSTDPIREIFSKDLKLLLCSFRVSRWKVYLLHVHVLKIQKSVKEWGNLSFFKSKKSNVNKNEVSIITSRCPAIEAWIFVKRVYIGWELIEIHLDEEWEICSLKAQIYSLVKKSLSIERDPKNQSDGILKEVRSDTKKGNMGTKSIWEYPYGYSSFRFDRSWYFGITL